MRASEEATFLKGAAALALEQLYRGALTPISTCGRKSAAGLRAVTRARQQGLRTSGRLMSAPAIVGRRDRSPNRGAAGFAR